MSRILLLEPNKLVAEQYKAFLNSHGHEVVHCQNAQTGIVAADKAMPDLIVAELQLVGHSGIEFLYEFRSYPEWEKVPVIILTVLRSSNQFISEAKLKQLGVQAYLYKPHTSLNKLLKVINSCLGVKLT